MLSLQNHFVLKNRTHDSDSFKTQMLTQKKNTPPQNITLTAIYITASRTGKYLSAKLSSDRTEAPVKHWDFCRNQYYYTLDGNFLADQPSCNFKATECQDDQFSPFIWKCSHGTKTLPHKGVFPAGHSLLSGCWRPWQYWLEHSHFSGQLHLNHTDIITLHCCPGCTGGIESQSNSHRL